MSVSVRPDLEEIHEELLVLLKKFHQYCLENGIRYSLHGGTLLGAIREHGFIPWDDDADVSLTRSEYKKLKKLLSEKEIGEGISFDDFSDRLPRLLMCGNKGRVVWIDIFIYDYISEKRISQKIKLAVLTFLAAFSKSRRQIKLVKMTGNCRGLKYWCYNAISLAGSIFPLQTRIKWMNSFSEHCFVGNRKLIHRGLDQHWHNGLILQKDVMKDFQIVPFENTKLMVSTRYHDILSTSYGPDYMTPKRFSDNGNLHDIAREVFGE